MRAVSVVVSGALSKNSHVEYPKQPFSFEQADTSIDPEANEKLAVAEMEKYIAVLKQQGDLPRTIMTDIRKGEA